MVAAVGGAGGTGGRGHRGSGISTANDLDFGLGWSMLGRRNTGNPEVRHGRGDDRRPARADGGAAGEMAALGPVMRGSVVVIGTRGKHPYFSLNKDNGQN